MSRSYKEEWDTMEAAVAAEREKNTEEREEFIETLKALKQWEWELVAEYMPVDLVRKRLDSEFDRLARYDQMINDLNKIGTTNSISPDEIRSSRRCGVSV